MNWFSVIWAFIIGVILGITIVGIGNFNNQVLSDSEIEQMKNNMKNRGEKE